MSNTINLPALTNVAINSVRPTNNVESNKSSLDFKGLLTNMLSSNSMLPGSTDSGSGMSDLTPLILLLITKLFGDGVDDQIQVGAPEGTPVKGPITQGSHDGHVALDFGVPIGTDIHSTMGGKVSFAGWNNEGYGNLVIVKNGDYETYYAHLSKIPVKVGQTILEGAVIGKSGNTGNSTGPHLHYEIRRNGVGVSPLSTILE